MVVKMVVNFGTVLYRNIGDLQNIHRMYIVLETNVVLSQNIMNGLMCYLFVFVIVVL